MKGSTPGILASDVWAVPGALVPRLNLFELLFFMRANSLGADTTDGTGAIAHQQGGSGLPYHTRLSSGNLVNDDVGSQYTNAIVRADRHPPNGKGGSLAYETHAQLEQLTDCAFTLGLSGVGGVHGNQPSAIFYYDSSVGGNWLARTYQAAAEQTDSGVAADTDFHIFNIVITTATVNFYIDEVLVATHVTQIPDAGAVNNTNKACVQLRTLAAAVKYAKYGYVALWNE